MAFAVGTCLAAPVEDDFHPRRLLVTARPGANTAALERLHERQGARPLRQLGRGLVRVVSLPPGASVMAAARHYVASGLVQCAEPDYLRRAALVPNDPKFTDGTLWGLHNAGQDGGVAGADISAPEAWEIRTSAASVVVAVLDTGIRATHEDLAANIWHNPVAGGYGWNALAGTVTPADDEGHGTLVAGVLGAVGNNGKGVVGVAWAVQIMACKCMNSQKQGYDSDIIEAIEFAQTNGAKIINMSLGSYAFSHALSNAIYSARQDGIMVVAAAGNDGKDIDAQPYYPASYDLDNIVSVAFTGRDDSWGAISNYGATNVDLAAPGASMYSTFFGQDNAYLGGVFLNGTSLAAPYVSGALALALEHYPAEAHTRTIQRLLAAAERKPGLAGRCQTGGRLNLRNLLAPPIALSLALDGPNRVISGRTAPERTCVVEASTNLVDWLEIGAIVSSEAGEFEFTDSESPGEMRFYRVRAD